jgi:hypothetical protein
VLTALLDNIKTSLA